MTAPSDSVLRALCINCLTYLLTYLLWVHPCSKKSWLRLCLCEYSLWSSFCTPLMHSAFYPPWGDKSGTISFWAEWCWMSTVDEDDSSLQAPSRSK